MKFYYAPLTEKEWKELVAIEYVLTWNYTDDYEGDLQRLHFLRSKMYRNQ